MGNIFPIIYGNIMDLSGFRQKGYYSTPEYIRKSLFTVPKGRAILLAHTLYIAANRVDNLWLLRRVFLQIF